ncbi:dna-directed rna polymerase i subunit rpa43-like [Plasmopara halstedii]|uniref:DNA-directed RNA polymerase I subunit RPA43 n=1 Tax=Plasmopara halstedii TaxID=4781 RepID=A0A0P1A5U2_PLAHL|nr:dna-directed rna polymerase i subunit rpa43-like [Plasmopara halstedii]CEG35897.1 dna-directed rna polymerase i subunit rpa43-like [Plasmopara halstedii]|eukprot:XP_024572266.1 dna-directed rna polymerase i subunit rpa43-like [Plasmopara halstedii]
MASNAFVLCKVRHSVSLSPCHVMNARVGIEQHLTEQLMRYSEPLQGVILSFSNIQLNKPYGVIVNEMPYIHCKVLTDALVFQPKKGMVLRGFVNKIGSNHVGMLFAGVFNGSVAEAELPKGYVHNYAQDCWLSENGSSISVGNEIDVKVLNVHVAGSMVAIEATMLFNDIVKAVSTKVKKAKHLNLVAGEPVTKEKKVKKSKGIEKHKKVTKDKKRKHDKIVHDDAVRQEAEPVEVKEVTLKKHKHKDKDAKKKKKHKKSKHD